MNARPRAPDSDLALVRRLLGLLRGGDHHWLLAGAALALLSMLSGIGLLAVSGHFITSMALVGAGGAAINYYTPAALIRLFAILRTGGRYAERLATHEATLRMLARLREWLFARLVPLAPARLGGLRSAELFSRLRADVDALEHAYLGVLVPLMVAAATVLVVLSVALCWLPVLALPLGALLLVAGLLLPRWMQRQGRAPGEEAVRQAEELRVLAVDGLRGRAELALYGAEAAHAAKVDAAAAKLRHARRRIDRLQALGGAGVALAAQCAAVAALACGLPALGRGVLEPSALTMLTLLALAAFEAIASLPEAWAQWSGTLASARRLFALADMPPAVAEPAETTPPVRDDTLVIRDLRLRHGEAGPWVLDGVDLDLPQGCRMALVGASGSGKSSLAGALLRLYPCEGSVTLGGVPLAAWRGDDLRARIALVDQQPYLFDASLRDNLRLARPEASDGQLALAIRRAQLDDYVAGLPHGLDTWVGENGVRVSGGEARRIAIARALLADAPVLILDEPLEGLDAGTAGSLYRALDEAMHGRSVLLITHRLGQVSALVDEVATLDGGRIVGRRVLATAPSRLDRAARGAC